MHNRLEKQNLLEGFYQIEKNLLQISDIEIRKLTQHPKFNSKFDEAKELRTKLFRSLSDLQEEIDIEFKKNLRKLKKEDLVLMLENTGY